MIKKEVKKVRQHAPGIKHQPFWIVLGVLFILSVIVVITNTGYENFTVGHSTVHPLRYVEGGRMLHSEIRNVEGFKDYTIHVKETIKDGQITITEDDSIKFDGASYTKVKIESDDADKINKIDFTIKVNEKKLLGKGIALTDVRLYINGKEMATKMDKIKGDYYYYAASITELGDLVIGKKKVQKVEPEVAIVAEEVVEPSIEEVSPPQLEVVEEPAAEQLPVEQPTGIVGKAFAFFKNFWGRG